MNSSLPSLHTIRFAGKHALVRVDFNTPLNENGHVAEDHRIRAGIPTLRYILSQGGSCIIMSHLGRPKGQPDSRYSLRNIIPAVENLLGIPVRFSPDCIGPSARQMATSLEPGEVLLLENLRFHKAEKQGDMSFAKELSKLGDVYVNDAFGAAHRNHASVAGVPQFFKAKCLGETMFAELSHANHLLNQGEKPFVALIGGAKVSDKITLLDQLLDKVDTLIVGGGMAYTFCHALGGKVGRSLFEADQLETAKALIEKAKSKDVEFLLPTDSVVGSQPNANTATAVADSFQIPDGWMGLDIGPEAQRKFSAAIRTAQSILWNGPMGVFEVKKFESGTRAVGEAVAEATSRGAFSLVGGGDSVAATNRFGLQHRMSHISTGGGALLAYFEGKPLPAITAFAQPLLS